MASDNQTTHKSITREIFLKYIENLKEAFLMKSNYKNDILKDGKRLGLTELIKYFDENPNTSILFYRDHVYDCTMAHIRYRGYLILTSTHLIFYTSYLNGKVIIIKLNDDIPPFIKKKDKKGILGIGANNTILKIKTYNKKYIFDIITIKSNTRNHIYNCINTIIQCYQLSKKCIDNKYCGKAIIKIFEDDILRESSLLLMIPEYIVIFKSILWLNNSTKEQQIFHIKEVYNKILEIINKDGNNSAYQFIGWNKNEKCIDPELIFYKNLYKIVTRNDNNNKKNINLIPQNKFDSVEMTRIIKSLNNQLKPLFITIDFIQFIITWQFSLLSVISFILIIYIIIMNYLWMIPTFLCLINIIFLIALKSHYKITTNLLTSFMDVSSFSKENNNQNKSKNIFDKIKKKLDGKKRSLASIQNSLAFLEQFFAKIRGLYLWRNEKITKLFIVLLFGLMTAFYFIPRIFLLAVVCVIFYRGHPISQKSQRISTMLKKIYQSIPADFYHENT